MNKKRLIQIIASVLGVLILGVCIFFVTKEFTSTSDGVITVNYVALDDTVIKSKEIEFNEGDSLITLIEENFENFVVKDGMVMSIEDFNTPSDWSLFLSIYVDGEMSMVGIKEIKFKDKTLITFKITEYIAFE